MAATTTHNNTLNYVGGEERKAEESQHPKL